MCSGVVYNLYSGRQNIYKLKKVLKVYKKVYS